jgi:high-affinity iron transporter
VLETLAWVAYAVPVLLLFLAPARRGPAVASAQADRPEAVPAKAA